MTKKKTAKGKRKNLLKTDPEQKPNISYEQKMGADPTISGRTVASSPETIAELKNTIQVLSEKKKEEVKPKVYVTSRPKTAFNMRKRYDQTN